MYFIFVFTKVVLCSMCCDNDFLLLYSLFRNMIELRLGDISFMGFYIALRAHHD